MMDNYAYVTLLYPNKFGICTYLDGVILVALGLRKQNVKHKLICLITHDVSNNIKAILAVFYDSIITVDYITPLMNKRDSIIIQSEIFNTKTFYNQTEYSDMCNIFTKLHIFNKKILPYDKIVFIDSDVVPLSDYDELFKLNTPAGWLEQIQELSINPLPKNHKCTRVWGVWKNLNHGSLIPDFMTDVYKIPGSCINAGLLVIEPNTELFDYFIKQLQTPLDLWFGRYKNLHKGFIDIDGKFVKCYPYPEQCYLTQHFSGKWHMIDGTYASWGYFNNSKGVHMAGLKYFTPECVFETKTWLHQFTFNNEFDKLVNEMMINALKKYPILKNYIYKHLKILIGNKWIKLKNIDSILCAKLTNEQKIIKNMIENN